MDDDENTNPGWTPDIAKAMTAAVNRVYAIEREIVEVLRDIRDELAMLRDDRRKRGDRRAEPRTGTDG